MCCTKCYESLEERSSYETYGRRRMIRQIRTGYEEFLKSRCIPKERDGIKFYLKELGLYEYDTLEIIKKTNGRIAEDESWLALTEDC